MYIAMAFPDGNAKTLQEGFEEHDKVFKVFALASKFPRYHIDASELFWQHDGGLHDIRKVVLKG